MANPTTALIRDNLDREIKGATDMLRSVRGTPNNQDIDVNEALKLLPDEISIIVVLLDRLETMEAKLKDTTFQRNTAYRLLNENDLLDYDLIMAKRLGAQGRLDYSNEIQS